MRKFIFLILIVVSTLTFAQTGTPGNPPDDPITPAEWIKNMNYGGWWLFTHPLESDNNIKTDGYSTRILDSLQAMGINGGRLQFDASDDFLDDLTLPEEIIDFYDTIIDDMLDRGMSICFMVDFYESDMTPEIIQRAINGWTQFCEAYKDKSHYFIMSPVIEFHGWEHYYLVDGDTIWSDDTRYDPQVRVDSLNWIYDTLTYIYRKTNPDRIMSYKPYSAARRADFESLTIPYADDPALDSGKPIYYMASMSGSYGLGDWWRWSENMDTQVLDTLKEQAMRAGLIQLDVGLHHAIEYREQTGLEFWVDHWDPSYWKRFKTYNDTDRWTYDQNLAYISFFMDTLKAIGTCGAGMQTNKFWNDKTDDLIKIGDRFWYGALETDTMSVKMMDLLKWKKIVYSGPQIFSDPITKVMAGEEYKYNIATYGDGVLAVESAPDWLTLTDTILSGTTDKVGNYEVVLTFAKDTQSFIITVYLEDPEILSNPVVTGKVGEKYEYTITTKGEGELLVKTSPDWITLTDNVLSGTPDVAGDYDIVLTYSTDTQSFVIRIDPEPEIVSDPVITGKVGQVYEYTVTTIGEGVLSLKTSPDWITLTDNILSGTPSVAGNYDIVLTYSTDTQSFVINVEPKPEILSDPIVSGKVGQVYEYTVTTIGESVLSLETSPDWLTLTDNVLSGTPDIAGNYDVVLTYATDTQSFIISIEALDNDTATSIIQNETVGYAVFPNPAHSIINFTKEQNSLVMIYDVTGELIISTTENSIKTDGLNKGIFIVLIKDETGKVCFSQKLIIN